MSVDDKISELVALHGEGGLSPTVDDWDRIYSMSGPVQILNLLAFEDTVQTPAGDISGAKAYADYSRKVGPVFNRVGGKRLFFGPVNHSFGLGEPSHWDAAILTQYPSADALADMWLDPQFVSAHESRHAGVSRSQVLVFAEAPAESN